MEVTSRAGGAGFERIGARVHYAVDPALPVNRAIADIDRAPRNAAGLVEFSSDVLLFQPRRSNGTLLVDIPNRGGPLAASAFSEAFLMEQGYTVAEIGWQFDVMERPNLLRLEAPTAPGVRGPVRAEFVGERAGNSATRSGNRICAPTRSSIRTTPP